MTKKSFFTQQLMQWHLKENKRKMPWKEIKDPYKIWLSEIILQQTRVEQGWTYYEKFIHYFPTIIHLANAKDEVVFKLWEGLGYYNRCKNLLVTARLVRDNYKGIFPANYEDIIALKGVGSYTASAIASFAYNQPYAVLDGNVFRVLSRYFALETPIDTAKAKQQFSILANEVLFKQKSALHNQAMMDFGATVCKPSLPNCQNCMLQKNCEAFKKGLVNLLPKKEKKLTQKNRWFNYFVFTIKDRILIHKRVDKDIWQNLHEFYLIETDKKQIWTINFTADLLKRQMNILKPRILKISEIFKQQLTHQKIEVVFIEVELTSIPKSLKKYQWISTNEIKKIAFPKAINEYLGMRQ